MSLRIRRVRFGAALSAALLGSTCLIAAPAAAQSNLPAPPAPPSGGYYMADGNRTTDYAAALASWRSDAQFAVDYTKANMGLEYAYVLGLNGSGQTIGINDSGVLAEHPLFGGAGKLTGLRTVAPAEYGNDGRVNPRRPWEIHGTHVAGTAAGARIAGQRSFGNAYGANIFAATINFAAGDFLWWKDQILDDTTVSTPRENIVDLAATGKVRIINNSWGSGTSLPYTATLATARQQFALALDGFYDPVLANDVLVVFSAGNGGGVHASIDAVTPLNDLRLRSNWLSVANYRADGSAAPSTSFCGQTATWCVAGPGSAVISSVNGYVVDTAAIQAKYTRAAYPGIYGAATLAQLQNAATNAWLTVLNGYLTRRATAAATGATFDEAVERSLAAQQAVAISLAYGARFVGGDPDGYTSTLANILTVPGNVALLGRDFSAAVLVEANTRITAELQQFIRYTGPTFGALTGTSMAAPNVSGFAALLMQYFPEYNTGLISDILVSSSKDLDTPGVDLKSGWGAPQMGVALRGPTALRQTREVSVASGTVDVWSNGVEDARDRYSAEVLPGFENDIGGIVKLGGGELILSGTSSYSGATRVEQGLLTVDGRLTRSGVSVFRGGTVGGNGTIATLTTASGGIVSPGSVGAIGTLSVAGAATLGAGSQLLIDIGASGTSDRLVAGSATLGGTLTLRPVNGLPRFGDSYTIVSAAGGITGNFADAGSFSAILFPQLRYGATQVDVAVAARPYAGVVAATPVQTAYARLLDGNRAAYAALRGTYDQFDLLGVGAIQSSLEALAPRAETARRAIGTVALDNMARFYRERTAAMRPGDATGGSIAMIGRPLEFAASAIVAPGQAMTVGDTPTTTTVRENVLPDTVSAYLAGGYLKGSGAAMPGTVLAGTRDPFDGFYIVGGIEAQVSDAATLGFGLSYSDIDGERRFGQVATGDLIQGTLYGRIGDVTGPAIDAQFGAGVFRSTTRRTGTLAGGTFDLTGRDDALALSSEVGASYNIGGEALRVGPRVAIRASRIDFTPIAERGTGPALLIAEDRFLSLQGRAGVAFDGRANGLRPFGSAYFVHDFEDRPGVFEAGFVGGTGVRAPFQVAGQDQDWGELGAGLAYGNDRVELSIAADATVGRDDVRNQSYRAGVKIRF